MRGAFLVSTDPALFTRVAALLLAHGGRVAPDRVVQVTGDDGVLFTVFGDLGEAFDVDLAAGVDATRGHVPAIPTLTAATCCWVECRDPDAFVTWVRGVAAGRDDHTWVLDGDGFLWTPEALTPDLLTL